MNLYPRLWLRTLWLAALVLVGPCRAGEVALVTYYDYAPWYYEDQPERGLNAALARRLTRLAAGRYVFVAKYIPRKRIDVLLAQGETALAVAWVAPRFFGDEARSRYRWTQALMEDESLIVSSRDTPLEYTGLDSLVGKRFSATLGHIYTDIDPMVRAGQVVRSDGTNMEAAIQKLLRHRDVDFGVIDRSTLNALRQAAPAEMQRLYVAPLPRTPQYTRHILVPLSNPTLAQFLDTALRQLARDPSWQAQLAP